MMVRTNQLKKTGGVLPMTIIRQPSLFSIQELYDMQPTEKYDAIIDAINLDLIYHEVMKKSRRGAPEELNYPAIIVSLFIRYVERIPTIKELVKRLKNDIAFKLDCGFLVSESVPSEASYSRLVDKLEASNVLEQVQEQVIEQALEEGFITDDTIAIDATHFEARDQAPPKQEKVKPTPKKRGRRSKVEREQWLREQAEKEANKPLYDKKNSERKNEFWYGYKAHLAVSASSQYILQSLISSGNLNDGKAAIPLLKGMEERLSLPTVRYQTMDAGYDFEPIYQQVYQMGQQSIIAYN